jgi:hypothetical protein
MSVLVYLSSCVHFHSVDYCRPESKMKYSLTASLAVLLQAAQLVNSQTPPGSQPSCEGNLGVNYNGTSAVETEMLLFPDRRSHPAFTNEISALTSLSEVSTQPTIYLNSTIQGTHMVVFTDLSISGARYNGTSLPLAQGLQTCRTTRLHWLQTGFTQAENGTFVSDTPALAPYGKSRISHFICQLRHKC